MNNHLPSKSVKAQSSDKSINKSHWQTPVLKPLACDQTQSGGTNTAESDGGFLS